MADPIRLRCIGGALVPVWGNAIAYVAQLGEGEIVIATIERERSEKSHRHQWAWLADAWRTLPEADANHPWAKTPETMRKHALIATGHANCEVMVFGSNAAAERGGAYLLRLASDAHGYAVAEASGATVRVWTPHSQSARAMGAERFQKSKQDILEWVAARIGVDPGQLMERAA